MSSAKRIDPRKLLGVRIALGTKAGEEKTGVKLGVKVGVKPPEIGQTWDRLGAKVGQKPPP